MTFSVHDSGPERPNPKAPAGDTYTHSLFFRDLAYAASASAVLLAALVSWMAASGASF